MPSRLFNVYIIGKYESLAESFLSHIHNESLIGLEHRERRNPTRRTIALLQVHLDWNNESFEFALNAQTCVEWNYSASSFACFSLQRKNVLHVSFNWKCVTNQFERLNKLAFGNSQCENTNREIRNNRKWLDSEQRRSCGWCDFQVT